MRTRNSWRNQDRLWKELGGTSTPKPTPPPVRTEKPPDWTAKMWTAYLKRKEREQLKNARRVARGT